MKGKLLVQVYNGHNSPHGLFFADIGLSVEEVEEKVQDAIEEYNELDEDVCMDEVFEKQGLERIYIDIEVYTSI